MLDGFLAEHPPVDLLAAAYLGYKRPGAKGESMSAREASKHNTSILQKIPLPKATPLEAMPEYLRSPEMLKLIADMKIQQASPIAAE